MLKKLQISNKICHHVIPEMHSAKQIRYPGSSSQKLGGGSLDFVGFYTTHEFNGSLFLVHDW